MDESHFCVDVHYRFSPEGTECGEAQRVVFGASGASEVEFLITTIPDRPPRPLREVASGGEISRIMLALKCTFGQADPVPTMIFDEIDVGVGGKTADAVADRLASLSEQKQLVCITHLAQIASRAHLNLKVEKIQQNGRLHTQVKRLDSREREDELVRMLGGEQTTTSKKFARELLRGGKRKCS